MSRLEFLDAGRGIAILGVIAVHTVQHFSTGINSLDLLISTGQYGVQLFFIISSYTMMHTLAARENKERYLFINFWLRRFFRIAIPFWVGIAVYQCFRFADVSYFSATSSDPFSIITSFLLIQGFWPTSIGSMVPGGASIATEVIFYMVFPFIFIMNSNVIRISLLGLFIIILDHIAIRPAYMEAFSLFDLNYNQQDIYHSFFYYYIFNQIPLFLFGILFYIFTVAKKVTDLSKAELIALMLFSLGFIIASPKLAVICLIGMLILLGLKKLGHLPNWLIFIGNHSYSLYLFHFAMLNLWLIIFDHSPRQHSIANFLLFYFLAVSGAILVSLVTKPMLEDAGSSIGRKLVSINEKRN